MERAMAKQIPNKIRVWQPIPWAEDVVAYKHDNGISSVQKQILKFRLDQNKGKAIPYECPVLETDRFTLVKKADIQHLSSNIKNFCLIETPLDDKTQAKLIYELNAKSDIRSTNTNALKAMLDALKSQISNNPVCTNLLKKYSSENLNPKRKINHREKQLLKPFQYFGNTGNYIQKIETILNLSDDFKKATVIKDVTCGSCVLTFYLAQKYPNKKFIASDINPEIISMLKYIQNTEIDLIRKNYSAHHERLVQSTNKEAEYKKMVGEYNADSSKQYSLLIFLQNHAYSNVHFNKNNTITSELRKEKKGKLANVLKNFVQCQSMLKQGNISFEVLDMDEAIKECHAGDFYFLTPPHEKDAPRLYISNINPYRIKRSMENMNEKNIPWLLTYSDNDTDEAAEFQQVKSDLFAYLAMGGLLGNKPKKFSIYTSKKVLNDDGRNKLTTIFEKFAHKEIKKSQKQIMILRMANTTLAEPAIAYEENKCNLAENILQMYGKNQPLLETQATAANPTLDTESPQTMEEDPFIQQAATGLIQLNSPLSAAHLDHQISEANQVSTIVQHPVQSAVATIMDNEPISSIETTQTMEVDHSTQQTTRKLIPLNSPLLLQEESHLEPHQTIFATETQMPAVVQRPSQLLATTANENQNNQEIDRPIKKLEELILYSFFRLEAKIDKRLNSIDQRIQTIEEKLEQVIDSNEQGREKRQRI